ncbi:hypothetical protein SNE40_004030 [Patella caerulea]|uniref:Uncharacterized protein n=1 Tax=Patella caerulea TaxID=87958 RepID=A0AAN8K959_PATCE
MNIHADKYILVKYEVVDGESLTLCKSIASFMKVSTSLNTTTAMNIHECNATKLKSSCVVAIVQKRKSIAQVLSLSQISSTFALSIPLHVYCYCRMPALPFAIDSIKSEDMIQCSFCSELYHKFHCIAGIPEKDFNYINCIPEPVTQEIIEESTASQENNNHQDPYEILKRKNIPPKKRLLKTSCTECVSSPIDLAVYRDAEWNGI